MAHLLSRLSTRHLVLQLLHLLILGALAAGVMACGTARGGGGGGSSKCEEDNDCDIGEYCDIDDGESKGRCRSLGGGVGSQCDSTADCSGDLRCLSGEQICVKTCADSTECGGATCIPVADAGVGYCDPSANNGANNGPVNNGVTNNGTNNGGTNNGVTNNGVTNNGVTNNGVNNGGLCASDAGCAPSEECCDGACVTRGSCDRSCVRDADCAAAEECCDRQCVPRGVCDPCGGRCTANQQCVNGSCVPNAAAICEFEGQPCDENTESSDTLFCFAGNNLDANELTCHLACRDTTTSSDCATGSYCVGLVDANGDPAGGACIRSNCTSPTRSATECAAAGPNGGTCFPSGNGAFYCNPAGAGRQGSACEEVADCSPGLSCVFGECQPLCTLRGSTAPCPSPLGCVALLDDATWGLCTDDCSGFSATASQCPTGQGCLPLTTTTGICTETGTLPARSACDPNAASPDCGPLTACTQFSEVFDATCNPLCDLSAANPESRCMAGEVCVSVFAITDTTGVCAPGCNPSTPANECTTPGAESCLPLTPTRGICLDSGDRALGGSCNLVDGSVFGSCGDNTVCNPSDPNSTSPSAPGICEELCLTFSSVNTYTSGCPDGDVCEIFGANWGVCTTNVLDPQLEAFEPCFTPGEWCSDDNLCLEVDTNGNAICVPLCRLGNPQGDDCRGKLLNGASSTCQAVFTSETLGACL